MVRVNPDPYLVLGVAPTATQAEITHAYRTHLRAHHPDTRPARSAQTADEHLRQVLAAYALLRDPARRADYDRRIAQTADKQTHTLTVSTPPDHPLAGPVQIPINYRRNNTRTTPVPPPPLQAGPVRRHR
jgi:curved DNA-binding protein CbpA